MLQDNSMAFDICRSLCRTVGFAFGISTRYAIQQLPPFAALGSFLVENRTADHRDELERPGTHVELPEGLYFAILSYLCCPPAHASPKVL